MLQLCATQDPNVPVGAGTVNVAQACTVLANWDRRNLKTSVGTHVWTELWRRMSGTPSAGLPAVGAALCAVPFNPADPVNTPRELDVTNASVVTRVMGELGQTVEHFADSGIPLDRPWGLVHFDLRNGEAIPIHGASGGSGVCNAITPSSIIPGVGFAPILGGSSYIHSVSLRPNGPDARAIVTYSQSTDPANPYHADMTKLYSEYGWVTLPFAEGDIRRDPNLEVLRLSERN